MQNAISNFKSLIEVGELVEIPLSKGYYASRSGHVYNSRGRMLKPYSAWNYLCYDLPFDGQKHNRILAHRVIASTFLPNPENKPQVNHKDGNKHNNCVDNLEWATRSENQKHRFTTLGHNCFGENNGRSKLSENDVLEIVSLSKQGYSLGVLSDMYGVTKGTVSGILRGYSWWHITGIPCSKKKYLS